MKALQISKIILAAALFLGTAAVWSCQSDSKPGQAKNAAEKADKMPGAGGKDRIVLEGEGIRTEIDLNTTTWPKEIPSSVPEFTYGGQIQQVLRGENPEGNSWTVAFKDVQPDALAEYEKLLKKAGYQTMKMTVGDRGSVTGRRPDGIMVTLALTEKEQAVVSIVQPKRPE